MSLKFKTVFKLKYPFNDIQKLAINCENFEDRLNISNLKILQSGNFPDLHH